MGPPAQRALTPPPTPHHRELATVAGAGAFARPAIPRTARLHPQQTALLLAGRLLTESPARTGEHGDPEAGTNRARRLA